MLDKAVAAVKADKTKALDMFTKGEGGFLDRDLYVFCGNVADAKLVANGNPNAKQLLGTDARNLKDSNGKASVRGLTLLPPSAPCASRARVSPSLSSMFRPLGFSTSKFHRSCSRSPTG
jgi:hypothetical protein